MNQNHDVMRDDMGWAQAEQWFMRLVGVGFFITAIISMIFGIFPTSNGDNAVRVVNIVVTLALGIGAIWSLWWSLDIERIYNLIDGFKSQGNTRTYAVAVVQVIIGILFGIEGLAGNLVMGALGIMMLVSAVFFVWRARQISRFS